MNLCWLLVLALASLSSVGSWLHPSSQIPVPLSRADDGYAPAYAVIMKDFNQALSSGPALPQRQSAMPSSRD